jgi:hypothetical protein
VARHRIQTPTPRLSGLLADVHRLATGRELQLKEALDYFGDPARLTSVVERSGVLAAPSKRRKLEALLSESRHGV